MKTVRGRSRRWALVLCSSAMVVGCGVDPAAYQEEAMSDAVTQNAVPEVAQAPTEPNLAADVPKAPPKLIKTAQLDLTVESMAEALPQVSAIAQQQQGDIVSLEDSKPQNNRGNHTATVTIRVPQAQLDATLEQLSSLGTVRRQTLSTQDVSQQLVDFQARLRNLRKTEEMLLKIMDRSGSMGDVLQVTQKISEVRSQIEQIDAQLKDIQNRIAYSTINLDIEAIFVPSPVNRPVNAQFGDTWNAATHSMTQFSVGLTKVFLWLLAYSPYLVLLSLPWLFLWYRKFKMRDSGQ